MDLICIWCEILTLICILNVHYLEVIRSSTLIYASNLSSYMQFDLYMILGSTKKLKPPNRTAPPRKPQKPPQRVTR